MTIENEEVPPDLQDARLIAFRRWVLDNTEVEECWSCSSPKFIGVECPHCKARP